MSWNMDPRLPGKPFPIDPRRLPSSSPPWATTLERRRARFPSIGRDEGRRRSASSACSGYSRVEESAVRQGANARM